MSHKNYQQLVQIHQEFKDRGFEILGFPCNQFREQEPGDSKEIESFARGKYGAEFPIFEKCDVNGTECHEVWKYLRVNSCLFDQKQGRAKEIPWNWAKFLVSSDGKVVKYFNPRIDPVKCIKDIEFQLEKL